MELLHWGVARSAGASLLSDVLRSYPLQPCLLSLPPPSSSPVTPFSPSCPTLPPPSLPNSLAYPSVVVGIDIPSCVSLSLDASILWTYYCKRRDIHSKQKLFHGENSRISLSPTFGLDSFFQHRACKIFAHFL